MMEEILKHPMYTDSDYQYLDRKGYTASEILEIWDRDHKAGVKPVVHDKIPNQYPTIKELIEGDDDGS